MAPESDEQFEDSKARMDPSPKFDLKSEVASPDGCFLVCPVSGRCFPKNNTVNEEAW